MSASQHGSEPQHGHSDHAHADHAHGDGHYVKVWAILLALLAVSIAGPELGIKSVTLFTAFGIAVIKAYMVAKNFMHLNVEKRFVVYLLLTAVAFMFLFYAGTAPDVMQHHGHNWRNVAADREVERALSAAASEHGAHGDPAGSEHH